MKPLHNHVILYDSECPLCNLYTGAFVKTGMLDPQGRLPFDASIAERYPALEQQRAGTEIPLVDLAENKIYYGVDSLFKIIEHSFPVFKPLFRLTVFRYLIRQLYFFISCNRKVIIPGRVFEGYAACKPALNIRWRVAFIAFAWIITSLILTKYSVLLAPLVPPTHFFREFLICGGQIVFQAIVVAIIARKRLIYYLGNMMTVSLAGGLLLLPMLWTGSLISNPYNDAGYFMVVVTLMFFEHVRRAKILELPFAVSVSWVIYRLLVLAIIL